MIKRIYLVPSIFIISLVLIMQKHGHDASYRWQLFVLLLMTGSFLGAVIKQFYEEIPIVKWGAISYFSLFFIWLSISSTWSLVFGDSILVIMTFSLGLMTMLLAYHHSELQQKWIINGLFFIAGLISLLMIYQSLILHISRPPALFLNPNACAAFLVMILLPACGSYLQNKSSVQLVFIFCICFVIALTQGRGVLLGLLGAFCLFIYVSYKVQRQSHLKHIILVLLVAYLSAHWLQILVLEQGTAISRVSSSAGVDSARLSLWREGGQMYLQRPFLGWGIGQFHWLHAMYRNPLSNDMGMFVHNDYFQFLIELGPIGCLLAVLFVTRVLWMVYRIIQYEQNSNMLIYYASLACACLGMFIHTFFTFHFYQAPLLMLMAWYIGVLNSRSVSLGLEPVLSLKPSDYIGKAAYMSVVGILTLAVIIWLGSLFVAYDSLDKSFKSKEPMEAFTYLERASRFNSLIDEFDARQSALLMELLKQENNQLTKEGMNSFIDYGLMKIDLAIAKHPYRSISYRTKAELLHFRGVDAEEQIRVLTKALEINPYDLDSRLLLVKVLKEQQKNDESETILLAGFGKLYNRTSYQVAMIFLVDSYDLFGAKGNKLMQSRVKKQIDEIAGLMMKKSKTIPAFVLNDILS